MAAGDDELDLTDDPGRELFAQVEDLIAAAAASDGVPALNEAGVLALRHPHRGGTRHLVAAVDGDAVGYGQLASDGTGQVVVGPSYRRRGVGRRLVAALLEQAARQGLPLRVWALGNTPAAAGLAARTGLVAERVLLVMRRPLADLPAPVVPPGVVVTTFRPGADEDAWLHVNARAFAHHPEQGAIDREDLAERTAEPWFDPAGFFLARSVEDDAPGAPVLGFHWTKQHDAIGEPGLGEVYVLGVDPDAQGRGLAKALLLTGLAHLRDAGDETVELYVEADQAGPVGLYTAYGFTESSRDVMYAGPGPAGPASDR
ncbi:mycothiol synthase [Microlunatus flavus]|uniref:Mycothiol acetyltransferase n=1 Tax=Microlunatus flavus TaxID=1036181 RepID=A0A1H8Z2D8_9ACTN|nr:mycothiol synthase [Microlunatus flavus]SEP58604.1 mycothiol synthase [Microlunatus flavus]